MKKRKRETFEGTVKSEHELYDSRKAHIVRDLLAPLVREASYGHFAGATYRAGDKSEWVRLYVDDGVTVLDVDVTGMGSFSTLEHVVGQAYELWLKPSRT